VTGQRASRLALAGFAILFLAVHGVIAALVPLQGDDWAASGGASGGLLGDAIGALVRSTWLHALLSPIVSGLLVVGSFVLAMRRLPDPRRGRDVLGVALVSCLLWIALPRAGAMWFHRSYVAAQLYGGAVAVWFLAAYRCRRALAGRAWPIAMAVVGLAAGLASRQVALMAVGGAAIAVGRTARAERSQWMLPGLAGAAVGIVIGFVRSPWGEIGRVFGRLEPNLVALAPLLRAGGPVIALVGLLWLATRLRAAAPLAARAADSPPESSSIDLDPHPRDRRSSSGEAEPAPAGNRAEAAASDPPDADAAGAALGWLVAWLGLGVAGLLGPRSSEATLLPAAVALTAAALPLLVWLAGVRWVRGVLVALVIGVHAWLWTYGLGRYAALGDAFRERMAAIAATPRGQVATVRPYPAVLPDAWSVGEDWADLALREALAERWGLAGIELSPPFRQLERSPGVAVALEVDGLAPEVVAAAVPSRWPGELAAARRRFAAVVARLRAVAGHAVVARLRVTSVELAGPGGARGDGGDPIGEHARAATLRQGRPVLAAWTDGAAGAAAAAIMAPEVSRAAPDATSHMVISIAPAVAAAFDEAWQVGPGGAEAVRCATGRCTVAIERTEPAALVLCNAERCLAVDAWVPRL